MRLLLQEGIGARNVRAFIDALRQASPQIHALRFTLFEDAPIAALVELLAVLDSLPHLTSLEIDVSQATGRLSAVKRELLARSSACVGLSLKVRRYLVSGSTWDPLQDGLWRAFFERVDWQVALGQEATGPQQKREIQLGRLAWIAFHHRQYALLRALKTVCPDACISLEGYFPSQREIHILSRIGLSAQMHLYLNQHHKLDAACRLLRDRRLRLTTFHVVVYVDLDARATKRLLTSISKAPHLTDLSIASGRLSTVTWPEEAGFPLPTTRRLEQLRLNVHVFAAQLPFAVRCLKTWPSQTVHLLMPRTDQWTVLCLEDCVQALRQTQRVMLQIHDEKTATTEVFHALRTPLDQWLARGHQTRSLEIILDITGSEFSGEWDDWVAKQAHSWPLRALSMELRVQWDLDNTRTLRWGWKDVWQEQFHSIGAKAFLTEELKLVGDVWASMATNGGLSPRDALSLAQVSRQTYDKAVVARRGWLAAQLAELMTMRRLSDHDLERYTRSRAQAIPDVELINEVRRELVARQAHQDQLTRLDRLTAATAHRAQVTPARLVQHKV